MNFKENNNKSILLISHNFSPELTGIGKYNGEMINWLAAKGFNCTVITTFPYYPHWKVQKPYKNRWYKKEVLSYPESNSSITIFRCPCYIPSNPTGKNRVLQDFSFWTSMFWQVLKFIIGKQKFGLIITVAPPFHLAYLGLMLKKWHGGKLLYHVQDMQIEAAQGLNMISNQQLLDSVYKTEKHILIKADYVSSISDGMIHKMKAKVNRKMFLFPNWVDTDYFSPLDTHHQLKTNRGYQEDDIIFLYSGAIGEKQGLETILLAAESLVDQEKIKFIICGSGPYKEKLIQIVEDKNLTNVNFLPVQDKELFNEFLNMADYHLVMQKSNVADLVMPSKLPAILAVGGICIVTAAPDSSLYNLINGYDLGYTIEPESYESLSKLIRNIKLDDSFDKKRKNARDYTLKYLNIDNVMNAFLEKVLQ